MVNATNSEGPGSITVRLRVMPESRAWNIRRTHTSLVTCKWRELVHQAAVWGNKYKWAGYTHLPATPFDDFDFLGALQAFISNQNFAYSAGGESYQAPAGGIVLFGYEVGPNGPMNQLPEYLMDRAAVSQQVQDWTQQYRDQLQRLNDQIAYYTEQANQQIAKMQREAEEARKRAEKERLKAERARKAESEWEFLGIRGREGGIEFGSAFAIEWDGYGDRFGTVIAGAGDALTLGKMFTDEERAGMYEYAAARGIEDYYGYGKFAMTMTMGTAAAVVTGGAAGAVLAPLGAGATAAFFGSAAVGSAAFSANYQYTLTGEVKGDVLIQDTALGIVTAGVLKGGGQALGALRNLRGANGTPQIDKMIRHQGGRLGGRRVSQSRLDVAEKYLECINTKLVRNADDFLDAHDAQGGFGRGP